ncbi:MAG TPA: Lrp/AsnC family transcriptional regulator [Casimicrobiaceae bacterium]|nr:Lrp/AsnC family transcriptional regulator [Casimicrobiaceae bacterium]
MDRRNAVQLLNDFQRDFPLVRAPYAAVARRLGTTEASVLEALGDALADGRVSRVGAVFRPGAIGASTLAALAVPPADLERVAAVVSARPEVNHNYEREHRFNLWFVATAPDAASLAAALGAVERGTGYTPVSLPLVSDYWIDLGFDLEAAPGTSRIPRAPQRVRRCVLSAADRRLVAALEDGLPLVSRPYAALARRAGVAEDDVLARLADWQGAGVVRRFGVVVRHRALGFIANAMCVWDVPDSGVDGAGAALAGEPGVTLCYARRRALPEWRYNLFCMLHGHDRATVEARRAELAAAHGLDAHPSAVLFTRRAFKQCGARYASAAAPIPRAA